MRGHGRRRSRVGVARGKDPIRHPIDELSERPRRSAPVGPLARANSAPIGAARKASYRLDSRGR
jgi:hypothetical protein